MLTSRPSRRSVLVGTAAAAALTTLPSLAGHAYAAATPAYRWRTAVMGGTGFVTGILFHPS
ncbi:twin-arginine translocation signal domain-containing protein, partial [Streptomyces sp. UG1]|uniref:twin-arginine translocation signal domain-containing protein n=1 Tax=Streptomyces sp. UG1 TaxID=3417652 RepID=UPI003CF7F186